MSTIEESIDVEVPLRTAYDQWTQFEEFPRFMEGVKLVKQLDATHLHWLVEIAGRAEALAARGSASWPSISSSTAMNQRPDQGSAEAAASSTSMGVALPPRARRTTTTSSAPAASGCSTCTTAPATWPIWRRPASWSSTTS